MVENEQSFGEYLRQLIRDSGITQHKFYTEGGLEPLFACWGNLSPSPFERFLQNRLRSCGAFFAYGTSENRGVM